MRVFFPPLKIMFWKISNDTRDEHVYAMKLSGKESEYQWICII